MVSFITKLWLRVKGWEKNINHCIAKQRCDIVFWRFPKSRQILSKIIFGRIWPLQLKTYHNYRHDFASKIFQKIFFLVYQKLFKNKKKIIFQEVKKIRKTIFCNILPVLNQKWHFEKKQVPKMCSKLQKCLWFLKIQMSIP